MFPDQHLRYRPDIDGLRALAVIAVIGFHAYPSAVAGGFVGVDIFFVISGFLISSIIFQGLDSGSFSFANFYARRIRRIFPALFIVLAACLAFGWNFMLTDEYILLGKHTLAGAAFGPNIVFLKEAGYFDGSAELKPLLHLWSLGIEEQFYIVWPLLLVLIWRRIPNLLWVIVFIALGSFALNIYLVGHKPVQTFYLPLTRCWELLLGSILAHASHYRKPQVDEGPKHIANIAPTAMPLREIKSALGVVLILVAIVGIDNDAMFPGWWALLPTLGTLLIISAGPDAWFNRKILAHPVPVFVGLISYPLYLWHWPLLSFSHIITDGNPGTARKTLIVLLSFVLSWLTYRYWENPFRKNKSAWHVVALVVLMGLVGVTGRLVQKSHGYPNRFPANVQSIVAFPYSFSYARSYRLGTCFVDAKKQGADFFSEECLAPAWSKSKKVFLWGDSHAAHLYPGLKHYEKEGLFRVIQFTAGRCPPILDTDVAKRPHCKSINKKILQLIKDSAPDLVIMAGDWNDDVQARYHTNLNALSDTIGELRNSGIKEIILVGPVPVWLSSAPKTLVKFSKLNNWKDPPDRLSSGFVKGTEDMDTAMEAIANKNGVSYLSPYRTFCNAKGCLAKTDGVPTAVDCCHLTDSGSIFLFKSNLARVLRSLRIVDPATTARRLPDH